MRLSLKESRRVAQRHQPRQKIRDTWAEDDGRSPQQLSVPISTVRSLETGPASFRRRVLTHTPKPRWLLVKWFATFFPSSNLPQKEEPGQAAKKLIFPSR
jgi:hypothetical protein